MELTEETPRPRVLRATSERDATTRETTDGRNSVESRARRREPVVTYAAKSRPSLSTTMGCEREKSVLAGERTAVRRFFKELPPRPSSVHTRCPAHPVCVAAKAERKEGGTLRKSRATEATRASTHTLCRSPPPPTGGGWRPARTLGRAARLIEGPTNLCQRPRKERKKRLRTQTETITLNGGSLGSWVDEERS